MVETSAEVERTIKGWRGRAQHETPASGVTFERGYFGSLSECDSVMREAMRAADAPQAMREKWREVVSRTKADA